MILATVAAAVIVGLCGVISTVMTKKMRDENSTQHDAVQRVISDHSTAIGGLTVEVDGIKCDVKDVKSDVREIRDAVLSHD